MSTQEPTESRLHDALSVAPNYDCGCIGFALGRVEGMCARCLVHYQEGCEALYALGKIPYEELIKRQADIVARLLDLLREEGQINLHEALTLAAEGVEPQ